jgi:hypothetical protein
MREKLARYTGELRTFTAMVNSNHYHRNRTVLLTHLVIDDESVPLCNHIWLKGKDALFASKNNGTYIRFKARVRQYQRQDGTIDYGLSRVKDVQRVS